MNVMLCIDEDWLLSEGAYDAYERHRAAVSDVPSYRTYGHSVLRSFKQKVSFPVCSDLSAYAD